VQQGGKTEVKDEGEEKGQKGFSKRSWEKKKKGSGGGCQATRRTGNQTHLPVRAEKGGGAEKGLEFERPLGGQVLPYNPSIAAK